MEVSGWQGTKWRGNIAENFNWLSRAHERYRQTDRQQKDMRQHIPERNVCSGKNICLSKVLSCRVKSKSILRTEVGDII